MSKKVSQRRRKGFGGLVQRGTIWYARWTEDGVHKLETTGIRVGEKGAKERALEFLDSKTEFARLKSKERKLAIIQAELMSTRARIAELKKLSEPKAVCGEIWQKFEESPRRRDITPDQLGRYKGWIEGFVGWIGAETRIVDVGWEKAEAYAKFVGAKDSPNTFNKKINALKMAWSVIGRAVGVQANPWTDIQSKRLDTHSRRSFSDAEIETMLAKAEGELRQLIAIGRYTGLRLGDACVLRWEDFHDGNVDVKTMKTGAKVSIPAHPRLVEILGGLPARGQGRNGYVLPEIAATVGKKGGTSNVSTRVTRLLERCGIKTQVEAEVGQARPDAGFHSLRHTFVSKAIEAGVPAAIVQALVGHTTAGMTAHYTHISDEAVLKAFRAMA